MEPTTFRDRLSMIDEVGRRIPLFPAEVHGKWRTRRTIVHTILILFFLTLPWIKMSGAPAVLLDLPGRQFALFGLKFWAHDGPLVFLVVGSLIFGLLLLTALFGRVWCGWACPQTVFLDGVIRRIERWTEGTHLQRRELDRAPLSFTKIRKKFLKWVLFIGFTGLLTHSFLAYFVGADRVLKMMIQNPSQNRESFVFTMAVTGVLLFDLTWFREQFCLIMCPYGRFQSVLLDNQSITVQYDAKRGEPRRGAAVADGTRGSCVSCNRCVQVCPTGIDIRNGVQMECIACTACIDACDEIMDKVKHPRGLIRYAPTSAKKPNFFRSRVVMYGVFLLVMMSGLWLALSHRKPVDVTILRAVDVPYFEKMGDDGEHWIVNSYRLHVHNQTEGQTNLQVDWADPLQSEGMKLQVPASVLSVKKNEFRMIPFLVEVKKSRMNRTVLPLKIKVEGQVFEVQFVGP